MLQTWSEIALIAVAVIIALLVLWIIISIPVWVAAKILIAGRVKFSRAMLVSAVGPIVYGIVFFISATLLSVAIGNLRVPIIVGFVIAFIAWIWVFKKGFHTGWLRALGIAILGTVIFAVIGVLIGLVIQAIFPGVPPMSPIPLQQA